MTRPPLIGRLLVRLWRLGERRQEVEADLLELFAMRTADRGHRFASWRYVADALSLWRCRPEGSAPGTRHYGGFGAMRQDVIFAARLFRRQPGLFGVTVAGLAVAIGISTAVFSIVNALAFADYGVSAPHSVFQVGLTTGPFTRATGALYRNNWAFSDYIRLKEATSSLAVVASNRDSTEFRTEPDRGDPLTVTRMAVSGNYFSVLGLRASLGRTLTQADDVPGAPLVVVSHGFWKNRLGADASILGRAIWLGDRPFIVIGVADRAHSGPSYKGASPAFWMTLAAYAETWTGSSKWNPGVDVLGRVTPGITRAQAEHEVRSIAIALAREAGGTESSRRPAVQLQSLDEQHGSLILIAAILMATVGLVVFLACANVTNLLLSSAAGRRQEIGTRLAIGASRGRVVRQLLTESLVLGLLGGAFGLLVAIAIIPTFAALVQLPPAVDVSPDLSVYAFTGLLTIAVGIIAGLAPARYGRRGDLLSALKSDQLGTPLLLPRGRLRSLLIGGQAAVSVVLLVLAALLTRALVQTAGFDLGYDASRLLSVSVGRATPGPSSSTAPGDTYWSAALQRVRQLPGVAGASLASMPPFSWGSASHMLGGRRVSRNETTPDYFRTLGVPLVRGRIYTLEEVTAEAPVAVISARLAREFWGEEDPIGSTLERVWGPDDAESAKLPELLRRPKGTRVIGVVAEVITRLIDHDAPTIYLPLAASSVPRLVVRAQEDPHTLVRPVRDALQALDPSARPSISFPLEGFEREREGPRVLALLAAIVGTTALGLAVIGLFGVTAFAVEQRRHEVSVRKALGASDAQLISMLLRESLTPVAVGLASGLLLSLLGGRVIQTVLYGVSGRDPIAILAAVIILVSAAAAAVFLPARRAAAVEPAQLLKLG